MTSLSVTGRCVKWVVGTVSPWLEGVEALTWVFGEVKFVFFCWSKIRSISRCTDQPKLTAGWCKQLMCGDVMGDTFLFAAGVRSFAARTWGKLCKWTAGRGAWPGEVSVLEENSGWHLGKEGNKIGKQRKENLEKYTSLFPSVKTV